jgi:AcrR family transcriptional regulator
VRGERTRRRIVEAAEELFRDSVYDNIAVSDIARASSTSVGTIYRYFDSKEDLLHLVLSNAFWRMYQASRGTWRRSDPPEVNLRRTTQAYLTAYRKERAFIGLALRLIPTSDTVRDLWWLMRHELRQRMQSRLEQDQAVADVLPLDPELMIRMLMGMVDDYAARTFIDGEYGPPAEQDVAAASAVLAEIWYRAVFGSRSRVRPAKRSLPGGPAKTGDGNCRPASNRADGPVSRPRKG